MPTFDPVPISLARNLELFTVVRYVNPLSGGYFMPLPNIVPLQIDRWVGARPSVARLRYIFSPATLGSGFPAHVEDVLSFNKSGPYIVSQDDRICILKANADGTWSVRFDGYAQVPQGNYSPKTDIVSFEALGVESRLWDEPVAGALVRQGPDPTVVSKTSDVQTGEPARFNPDGIPNATPAGSESGTAPRKFPIFFSQQTNSDGEAQTDFWTLPTCAKYISGTNNAVDPYVLDFADYSVFDQLLDQRTPNGVGGFDPNNPNSYFSEEIVTHDLDIAGDVWPVAIEKLLEPHGFGFYFRQSQDSKGFPLTTWNIYRNDGGNSGWPKQLYTQAVGSMFDPSATNATAITISRDASQIRNSIVLDTKPVKYEASFILAPGFNGSTADADSPNPFIEGDPGFKGANLDKYRLFILGEGGDPWYSWVESDLSTVIPSLDTILGAASDNKGKTQYVNKRRRPINELVTKNNGKKMTAQLWLSTNYSVTDTGVQASDGTAGPGVWDGSGDWWEVDGGWQLLEDRIGIRLTLTDVRMLKLKTPTRANIPNGGKVNVLQSIAAPTSVSTGNMANNRIWFRLTVTIEGDQDLSVTSDRRISSSTQFVIVRRINARDRFEKEVVCKSSIFNPLGGKQDFVAKDETPDAQAYADAMRAAYETATFAGAATIPRWTGAYQLGDFISEISGRGISFRMNNAAEQNEAPRYPMIVGITEDLDGGQSTLLHMCDLRALPPVQHVRGGHSS